MPDKEGRYSLDEVMLDASEVARQKASASEYLREMPNNTRIRLIEALYMRARNCTIEEFAIAFDNVVAFRQRGEVEQWRKLAQEAMACRTPVYIVGVDRASGPDETVTSKPGE